MYKRLTKYYGKIGLVLLTPNSSPIFIFAMHSSLFLNIVLTLLARPTGYRRPFSYGLYLFDQALDLVHEISCPCCFLRYSADK